MTRINPFSTGQKSSSWNAFIAFEMHLLRQALTTA